MPAEELNDGYSSSDDDLPVHAFFDSKGSSSESSEEEGYEDSDKEEECQSEVS